MFKAALAMFGLIVLTGASWFWYRQDSRTDLPPLRTVPVERGKLVYAIDATGTVEPEEVIDVGAQVAGKIESLGVDPRHPTRTIDYGSPVAVGTVLAVIDDSLYQSDVEQCQAQVESAAALADSAAAQVTDAEANVARAKKDLLQMQAKLFQAERDWARAQELWKSRTGALTEGDLDLARSTYEAADATVGVGTAAIDQAAAQVTVTKANVAKTRADHNQALANLHRAQTNLGYCTIKSPVEGIIIDRRINTGQTVVSSLNSPSLFLIAKDLKRMQVWASVNEADIGHIQSGQKVSFTVDAFPGKKFLGEVAADQPRLNASMNQNVVTYTVVVNTDNSSGLLIPYLTADVSFDVAQHDNVLMVPNAALRWQPSVERLADSGLSPSFASAKLAASDNDAPGAERTLWIADGPRVRPVKVREVLSDGMRTEVEGADLHDDMQAAIGEKAVANESDTTDPFSTKIFGTKPK